MGYTADVDNSDDVHNTHESAWGRNSPQHSAPVRTLACRLVSAAPQQYARIHAQCKRVSITVMHDLFWARRVDTDTRGSARGVYAPLASPPDASAIYNLLYGH